MIVVKVGGSLYDHPKLGPGLRTYLDSLSDEILIVPGGGPFAEAVRELDLVHGLGESASHWLALRAMDLAGAFLKSLGIQAAILDAIEFGQSCDDLPRSWEATSDSVAAHAASARRASRLVLLKSIAIPAGMPWLEAASRGWVDSSFPNLVANAPYVIEAVNFRALLDA